MEEVHNSILKESSQNRVEGKVSVVVPSYNRANLIKECLESVWNQTYRPIELVVVDDGSTDKTGEVVNDFIQACTQEDGWEVHYFKTENRGAPHARNYGYLNSTGKYVVFLDSDDMLKPEKVQQQLEYMTAVGYDLVYSRNQMVNADGVEVREPFGRQLTGDERDHVVYSWQTMCALYRADYVDKIGLWNERLRICQDWEYSIRAILAGGKIGFLARPLQIYRYHDTGRIGDTLDVPRLFSRAEAYCGVFEMLRERGLDSRWLTYRYQKSVLFCLIALRNAEAIDASRVLDRMVEVDLLSRHSARLLEHLLCRPIVALVCWGQGFLVKLRGMR